MTSSGRARIERWFPNLRPEDYEIVAPEDPTFNCVAWAAGHSDAWWEPSTNPAHFWPDDAPPNDRIDSLVRVFQGIGYEEWQAENDAFEAGYEKVAIYGKDEAFTHVARQLLEKRKWTSKLGVFEVIEHANLAGLTGESEAFGLVVKILRRTLPQEAPGAPPQAEVKERAPREKADPEPEAPSAAPRSHGPAPSGGEQPAAPASP
jgi:hypothetical protein